MQVIVESETERKHYCALRCLVLANILPLSCIEQTFCQRNDEETMCFSWWSQCAEARI